jgi:DNA-binding NtrC family response regulator
MFNFKKVYGRKIPVLITGETGVGKSTYARSLHQRVCPADEFLSVNIASISDQLFESELFGHRRGSFTGAIENKPGLLEIAKKGLILLDEIGDLSLTNQVKLLHVLDSGEYFPVGSTRPKQFEGWFVFATHKDLKSMVKEGKFREDLYYRISSIKLRLPSLRKDRKAIESELSPFITRLSKNDYRYLVTEYSWPGNYRELKSVALQLECAENESIELSKLEIQRPIESHAIIESSGSYYEALEEFEKKFFRAKMLELGGRVNYASEKLGLSKSTLIAKLRKYGISSLQIRAMSQEGLFQLGKVA